MAEQLGPQEQQLQSLAAQFKGMADYHRGRADAYVHLGQNADDPNSSASSNARVAEVYAQTAARLEILLDEHEASLQTAIWPPLAGLTGEESHSPC